MGNQVVPLLTLGNETLRVEFANKANSVGPWIKSLEERLRSIALTMEGPLEVCRFYKNNLTCKFRIVSGTSIFSLSYVFETNPKV